MNITPFIDVLLVLLVIFMVSVKTRQVLQAQLAQEHLRGESALKQRPIVLELMNDGSYRLNQQAVTRAELPSYLTFPPRTGRDRIGVS